jgi:hypothetical protein
MKQIYALLLFLCVYSITNAQVKKGDIVLGGNLAYSYQSQAIIQNPPLTVNTSGLTISPSFGKAIKDNLVLGIDLTYTHNSYTQTPAGASTQQQTMNGGGVGVFIRRYKPIGAGFSLFGQARLSGNYSRTNYVYPSSDIVLDHTDNYGLALNLYPGIAYSLNRKWQMEVGLPSFLAINYGHAKETQQNSGQPAVTAGGHNFSVTSSLTGNNVLTAGVRYFIGS